MCFIVVLAVLSPRLALFALWLFSDVLSRAFDSWAVPLIGFLLLPWTTLAYALLWWDGHRVYGFDWFIVGLAFCIDLASWFGGGRHRARTAASSS